MLFRIFGNFRQTKFEICDEIVHVFTFLVLIVLKDGAEQEPPAAKEVSDDASDNNQSEDPVDLEHDVLSHDLLVPARLVLKRIHNFLEF